MKYILLILLLWIAPAVLVLAAAAWFLWSKGGKLHRGSQGKASSRELSSNEES